MINADGIAAARENAVKGRLVVASAQYLCTEAREDVALKNDPLMLEQNDQNGNLIQKICWHNILAHLTRPTKKN
jgi:hypothetical protein